MQWKELLDSHSLYVPSLSNLASGPVHTFFSRSTTTTVDYIIGNLTTSTAIVSCIVEEEHPLNTSDHLPIISNLNFSLLTLAPRSSDQNNSLDWNSALRHGCIPQYASLTDEAVAPLLNKDYCSVEEIEADISHVSNVLIEASTSTIPHFRCSNSNSNRVSDPHLSSLCWQSRVAYRQWKAAGCPRSGPLFQARKNRSMCNNTYPNVELGCNMQTSRSVTSPFIPNTQNVFRKSSRRKVAQAYWSTAPLPLTPQLSFPTGHTTSLA